MSDKKEVAEGNNSQMTSNDVQDISTDTTDKAQTEGEPANPLYQKYEEYRSAVIKNPDDFQTWTYLLSTVERIDEMEKIVLVFDEFLKEYPLCYGYWKKYADATTRHLGLPSAINIYERGLAAVPYSVDLWIHFLTFRMTKTNEDDPITLRNLFERAIAYVGRDFQSHALWDKYLEFESVHGTKQNVRYLYERILTMPCKELHQYHEKFLTFAEEQNVTDILTSEEIDDLKKQLMQPTENDADPETEEANEKSISVDGDVPMQDNGSFRNTDETEMEVMDDNIADEIPDESVKKLWTQSVKQVFDVTAEELATRRQFEDCLKRPYFHVKPLDNVQLQAWWKYLDFEYSQGDHRLIVILFERCLVACASYPEFWIRYVRYMENFDVNEATNILKRATYVFCKNKSEIYLFAAHFFEIHDDIELSRQCLQHVTSTLAPSLLAGILQHVAFEYRNQAVEAGNQIFEEKLKSELDDPESTIVGHLAVQYASLLFKLFQNKEKARILLDETLGKRPDLMVVWEGAILLEEMIHDDASMKRIADFYNRCSASKAEGEAKTLNEFERYTMIRRYLNFLEFHGDRESYDTVHRHYLEAFGLWSIVPSLSEKYKEQMEAEKAGKKRSHNETTSSAVQDTSFSQPLSATAISEYLAQNPTAQQYAQYYQYAAAAAAAAAGYGSLGGYTG